MGGIQLYKSYLQHYDITSIALENRRHARRRWERWAHRSYNYQSRGRWYLNLSMVYKSFQLRFVVSKSLSLLFFLWHVWAKDVENQGLCPTFKWRRNLQSFYRARVFLEKHQSILIGKTVPQRPGKRNVREICWRLLWRRILWLRAWLRRELRLCA